MVTNFKLFESLILEDLINPEESYASFVNLKKYKNQKNIYIHFTDLNKLGINPQKGHYDPHGIYFYPAKFIFGEDSSSMQYGYSMKYYYICRVNTKNFLKINSITFDDIENFFETAGLSDIFHKINFGDFGKRNDKKLWEVLDMLNVEPSKRDIYFNRSGSVGIKISEYSRNFYKTLPHITWNRFFGKLGYDGIIDNKGVVNENEPEQLIVFNSKTIEILENGENKIQKNYYQTFFNDLKNKLDVDYFNGKYVTEDGQKIYKVKTKKDNIYINFDINFNWNIIIFYYIKDNLLKTHKIKTNSFGEYLESITKELTGTYKSCYDKADKGEKIEDHIDTNFESLLKKVFKYVDHDRIGYDEGKITYYEISNSYLKFIYNVGVNYEIEYYPFSGNDTVFFKFDFNDFKNKLHKRIEEHSLPEELKKYLISHSLFREEIIK